MRVHTVSGGVVVEEGQQAPAFALSDDTGRLVRLEDFRGHPLVLWFYVRDDTAG